MSYGTGRFSSLDLPDPTLRYVARKAFKHFDLVFQPGDPVSAELLGERHLTKYIRARLVELPVKAGEAALLQEPKISEPADADEVVVIRFTAGQPITDEARATARAIDARMDARQVRQARTGAEVLIEEPTPAAAPIDPETMTKAELSALIDDRGLQVDKRLPLGAMRAKVAAALEG